MRHAQATAREASIGITDNLEVAAQVEFEAVAGVDEGDVYSVDIDLERGRSDVEVWIPESVSEAIPADLEALLESIASTSVVDSGAEQRLVARNEVRL